MFFPLNAACGCVVGTGRSNNEDNFYFHKRHLPALNQGLKNPLEYNGTTEEPIVFSVFDGMGGACRGEEAACISGEIFSTEYKKLEELAIPGKEFLFDCCQKANDAVNQFRQEQQLSATGATVAAIYFLQDEVIACNVGDSKIFCIREQKMLQISEDHTDEKIISAMGLKKKPELLQDLGVPDTEMAITPYFSKGKIQSGDIYVLCSVGVTDALSAGELYGILSNFETADAVKQITEVVNKTDGSDNATVIVIKIP